MKNVIYKITSSLYPNRIYIGSAFDFKRRKLEHLKRLRSGKHPNIKLSRHMAKYGIDDLCFSIIESCNSDELTIREQHYMDNLNPWFNICKVAGRTTGIKQSKETKLKRGLAIINTCKNRSDEDRERIREIYRKVNEWRIKPVPAMIGRFILVDNGRDNHRRRIVECTCIHCGYKFITNLPRVNKNYLRIPCLINNINTICH